MSSLIYGLETLAISKMLQYGDDEMNIRSFHWKDQMTDNYIPKHLVTTTLGTNEGVNEGCVDV